jgi:GMP synthase (glutamine-hydrolysing)
VTPADEKPAGPRRVEREMHTVLDEAGTLRRIETYRHAGYFAPEEMDEVIARVRAASVTEPPRILANFVQRFAR